MINVDKVLEGVHYELIAPDVPNDQAWDIRVLEGEFVESILRFGNVAVNGKDNCLNFNFNIISSPDPDLTVAYEPLQLFAGAVLEDILEQAIASGKIDMQDVNED